MTDIFDTKIHCRHCDIRMEPVVVERNGLELRAIKCPKCGDIIIHPADLNGLQNFNDLKDKKFNVKLRMVGNSHAISIPKEIIDFMNNQHKAMKRQMDDMVRLCFEDYDTLRLHFGEDEDDQVEEETRVASGDGFVSKVTVRRIKRGINGKNKQQNHNQNKQEENYGR